MPRFRTVCVFCGAAAGNHPSFLELGRSVGSFLAERDISIVFGGGNDGIMGAVANAALAKNGKVIGVYPGNLWGQEAIHPRLTKTHVVSSMAERKQIMSDLSDAFLILPGGLGTLDELTEMLTWTQLGLQSKICGIINLSGFFDPLLSFFEKIENSGLMHFDLGRALFVDTTIEGVWEKLENASI